MTDAHKLAREYVQKFGRLWPDNDSRVFSGPDMVKAYLAGWAAAANESARVVATALRDFAKEG